MRFGCSIKSAGLADCIIKNGFDYLEMNLCALAAMSPLDYEDFRAKIAASPLKIEVFNLLLPLKGEVKIIGDETDPELQRSYMSGSFKRAHEMGADMMVFGSARARAVPEGYPPERARQQLVEFMKRMMEYADLYNITMVIEPICGKECAANPIRTIPQAIELAKEVGHPNLFALCDFYHMYFENEPAEDIIKAGSWIKHAHISAVDEGRSYPALNDGFEYGPFFEALKKIGYNDRMSLESFGSDVDKGSAASMELLRSYR